MKLVRFIIIANKKTMINCIFLHILFLALLFTSPLKGDVEAFSVIFNEQVKTLSHLNVPNPSQIILFSGSVAMGKTFTAKKLEEHFKAIRLNSDQARMLFLEKGLSLDLVDDYLDYCLSVLSHRSPNGTIIMDRSCDRSYDRYAAYAKNQKAKLFLIRLVVPRDLVEKRIVTRGDTVRTVQYFLDNFDDSWRDYEKFALTHSFDFYLDNSDEKNTLFPLIEAIEKTRMKK
jgi:predicted kinase